MASIVRGIRVGVARFSRSRFFRRFGPTIMPPLERGWAVLSRGGPPLSGLLVPSLVLHTTGARSGLPRASALMYCPEPGGAMLVTGSNFAGENHPAWSSNLLAHPDAEVEVGRRRVAVRAVPVADDEREAVWAFIESQWPGYRGYERASGRTLRIFRLTTLEVMGETDDDDKAMSTERFEELRVQAVERLNLVDTPGEERFDRITRIARELFGVPVAEINLLDASEQFTKSPQPKGSDPFSPRSQSFCDVAIQRPEILVVPDATKDDRFSWRDTVTGERQIRFYAGRPLSLGDQYRVGTLCLVDTAPREFSDTQLQLLEEFGEWVERELQDSADRDRAAEVQQLLLPRTQPGLPVFDVAGVCLPSRTVAGDFYSWHGSDTGIELTLADVMGKGTAGAILAATVRAAFQSQTGLDVVTAIERVNQQLADDLGGTGSFATLFHARIDAATGRIDFADAGHGLTVVVHPDGSSERLAATGLPIGIVAEATWTAGVSELAPGDRLISFTDGLLDLYDGTLESLGEITALVGRAESAAGAAADVAAAVAEAVATTGRTDDDVTAVVVFRA